MIGVLHDIDAIKIRNRWRQIFVIYQAQEREQFELKHYLVMLLHVMCSRHIFSKLLWSYA